MKIEFPRAVMRTGARICKTLGQASEGRLTVTKPHRCAVLCIGNDPIHLNLRCSLLTEQDWRVLTAGSGYEGVIRFSQEPVDAVVMDLDGDGAESALITGELKRLRPRVPVIQVVDGKNLSEGATAQADAVVAKSEESQVLVETLRTLLRAS